MEWWRGSVIYQVYPRSFQDSDNDGVGDIPGLISRLPYLKSLGVEGVWVSPFFRSPMKDFGYDISDYRDIDPVFGTMADFDELVAQAHLHGMKIIIDQVYSHTSDQHEWFRESRSSRDNPKADWYVWADARADGGPPNNWISLFGGQAWSWDTRRNQYYMHNFLTEQPDLNFHNPDVRREILAIARFWLDKGVDGFRLDVANFYFCDRQLRDNPPKNSKGGFPRPYWHQLHRHDRSQPENLDFMADLRKLVDQYPGRMTVAEIGSDSYIERSIEYSSPGRLHTAYNFLLLDNGPLNAQLIRSALETWTSDEAWPSWSFSNHDVVRSLNRWGGPDAGDDFARLLLGMLMTLRGTIFLYQGEELGLPQADVPFERLRDPEGIRFWPDSLGRDGCRTPMPWAADETEAGFTGAEPWLPIPDAHKVRAVDAQEADPGAVLHASRAFIALRKANPALVEGDISFLNVPEPVVAFHRRNASQDLLCVFNLSQTEANVIDIPDGYTDSIGYPLPHRLDGLRLHLPPCGGAVLARRMA